MKAPIPAKPNLPFAAVSFGYNSCDFLCLLERFPEADGKTAMRAFDRQGGGQAATAAATVARLGLRARYLGVFGDTPEGAFARETLVAQGVDVEHCRIAPNTQNQIAVIWVDLVTGTRTIAHHREPGLAVMSGAWPREMVTAGSVLMLDCHHLPASIQMARWAREEGIPVLLDAGKVQDGVEELLAWTDYILCDAKFPAAVTGSTDIRDALAVLQRESGAAVVAATLGVDGAVALANGTWLQAPAFPVDVVDSTGAGDVWHGAFAAGLVCGLALEEILRFASGAAALKCRSLGGRSGIPDREELNRFLTKREG
jgi:sulfofructose kinase